MPLLPGRPLAARSRVSSCSGALLLGLGACSRPWTETDLQVSSLEVGDTYDVRVVVPEGASEAPWPVLLFQDGDYWPRYEGLLADAIDEGAPGFVLVAVGYQGFRTGLAGGLGGDALDRRLRDITEEPIEGVPGTGGARTYQAFLDDELLPAVAEETGLELSSERARRATYGYSAFGLAVTQGLLWESPTWGGYCAGSPSLRRLDAPIFDAGDDPEAGSLSGWALFMVGSREVEDSAALDDLLAWLDDGDHPDLAVDRETLADLDHRAAQKPAFAACLDALATRW